MMGTIKTGPTLLWGMSSPILLALRKNVLTWSHLPGITWFFQASHDREKPAVLSEKTCYTHFAHPEDRATLGSDPSAEVGGYTVRQGLLGSALFFQTPESPRAINPNHSSLQTSRNVTV